MLFGRAITLQLSKQSKPSPSAETPVRLEPDEIATVIMYHATDAAILIGKVYVAKKLVDTACRIAIIKAGGK